MNCKTLYVRIPRLFSIALILFALLLVVIQPPVARAAAITVNSTAGTKVTDGACTLREAIENANNDAATWPDCAAGSGADIISLPSGATITLLVVDNGAGTVNANGLPAITSDITINGNDAIIERSSAGGAPNFRIFQVLGGATLTLNNATVRNGRANDGAPGSGGGYGGGIRNNGTLNVNNSTISGNRTGDGGWGGGGGGIGNAGTLNITNSTISGNRTGNGSSGAGGFGGGILSESGMLNLTNSTLTGNTTGNGASWDGFGGGVSLSNSSANITNCTIYNNTAGALSSWGGGIYREGTGALYVTSTTVAGNTANNGGGVFGNGGTSTLKNTIVANNTASPDSNCGRANGGTIVNGGNNLDSGTSCGWGSINGSMSNTNPLLGALANNGGPTQTMALLPGSPAIDGVTYLPPNGSPSTDQRGVARPQGVRHDVGAYEFGGSLYYLPFIRRSP